VVRLLVALPLIVVASKSVAGAAMVAAGLAGAFIPLYVGRGRLSSVVVDAPGKRFSLTTALAFAAPASIIAIADQFLVNGGSLLVMLEGGADASKAAGIVFAATMLVRAPVYVFQGLAASLLPNLTHIHALDDTARFRRAVLRTVGFLLAAGVLIVAFAAVAGPETMKVLYGTGFEVGRYELTLLAAGVGCYLAAATCSQALLALDSGARAAVAWTTSSAVFIALYFLLSGSELERISLAFVLTALVDFALLGFGLARKLGIR